MAFGLLFGTFQTSHAVEILKPSQEDIDEFLLDYTPLEPDNYFSGLYEYFESVDSFVNFGLINDDTGTVSYGIDYYAGTGFGGWRSETNWGTGTDVAISKTFAVGDIRNALKSIRAGSAMSQISTKYFSNPGIGYTIKFLRDTDDVIPKGTKIALNLTFDDSIYSNTGVINFYDSGSPTASTISSGSGAYIQSPMLDVTYNRSQDLYFAFNNVVTVGGIDLDGNDIVIAAFDNYSTFTYDFKAPSDLQYFYIDVCYNAFNSYVGSSLYSLAVPLVYNFSTSGSVVFDESSQSIGLLQGIIEWLRNILNAILDLPSQIWAKIENGLKLLFIPSPDFISASFDSFKDVAESKLGFLYTILDMVVGLFQSLISSLVSPVDTLTIPSLALPFPYTDSGYIVLWEDITFDVKIEGLDVLYSLVHLVTSILLITITINYCVEYLRKFFSKE